ncbi:Galactose transporter [Wickerhamomyces ciferrii]|uniref:Galactose transporter n=1 Tax=Wickerhamomyces ciferrii (strain ATCC 14091 / BCRC 22168 / CBS 111 / JCM 3599 / NBRC 0793 / NRRL Y-1031 F-60-10) TaxID=1206466 RepID=K0KV31_WICCF|nr:Galactose transporter [Wickerhamomyces ciferrii]CCH47101.1 Galactose transporter [Wickerhamomyces ciferrii]
MSQPNDLTVPEKTTLQETEQVPSATTDSHNDYTSTNDEDDIFELTHTKENVFQMAKKNPLMFIIVVFATLAGFLFGYDQGVAGPLVTGQAFGARFPRIFNDSEYKGWFVSTLLISAWLGAIVCAPMVDRFGRRDSIIISSTIFIIGSVFQCAGISVSMLFGGRAVTGFGVGILTMLGPLYISELSVPSARGSLVSLQQLSITFGILVAYWVNYGSNYIGGTRCSPNTPYADGESFNPYTDVPQGGCDGQRDSAWRFPFGLQILPAAILAIGMFFLPRSPRWLMIKGREEESLNTLAYLRRLPTDDKRVQAEFLEIKGEVLFEKTFKKQKFGNSKGVALAFKEYKNLFNNKANFRRVFIGSAIMFEQQFIGCNAIIYYSVSIFSMLGLSGDTASLLASGVYGIVNFVSTIPAVLFLDKFGRKKMLQAGSIGTFISLIIVGSIIGKYDGKLDQNKAAGWTAIAFVYIYDINFSYSWAPIGWVYPSEIFPLAIRSKAISITTSSTWMNNFIIGLITPIMLDTMKFGTFIFFAAFAFIGFLFVWFLVPETMNRTLEEMDEVFGDLDAFENKRQLAKIQESLSKNPGGEIDIDSKQNFEHLEDSKV